MLRLFLVILCVIGGPGALAAQEHLFHGASGLPHGIPDFCARASNVARASGNWSDRAIWSAGHVPSSGERVAVSAGATVTYDTVSAAALNCVDVLGTLRFRPDVSTELRVGTLIVKAGGTLEIGTTATPVAPDVTAQIVFLDQPLDTQFDPEQYGVGLLGFGTVNASTARQKRRRS